jgi:hypothetical protein
VLKSGAGNMQIRTESSVIYKEKFEGRRNVLNLTSDGKASDIALGINLSVDHTDFSDDWDILIELKKEFSVSLWFNLVFFIDDCREILGCDDLFPIFNSKYFAPVFKKVITDSGNIILHSNKNYHVTYTKLSQNSCSFQFMLDAACMHPSWNMAGGKNSTANEKQPSGTIYKCNFSIMHPDKETDLIPAMPLLYPSGCKAGFILTDHCDFDTEDKLRLFLYGNNNDGWLNKGLKITKGVFTLSSRSKDFDKNDSLEDEGYLSLIKELHADGSEIVPHALKSKGQLSKDDFQKAIEKIDTLFKPATWIDHGSYLKYCYSQGGKINQDYKLVDTLKKYHYSSLWSFHDVNTDAINTLNIFSNKIFSNKAVWNKFYKYFFTGKLMIAAHHFRSVIHRNYKRNKFSDFMVYSMAQAKGSFIKWKTDKKKVLNEMGSFLKSLGKFGKTRITEVLPYSNEDLLQYSAPIFLEERRPLAQYKEGDLLMFSTFETTHVIDIYNKEALDKLVEEYGLHIGHTYILNDLPYLSGIFTKEKGQLRLANKWIKFTEELSNYMHEGRIWNANMRELIYRIKTFLHVEFEWSSPKSFTIKNNNNYEIADFTFIVPSKYSNIINCNKKPVIAKLSDHHFHFFCISLLQNEKVTIDLI